MRSIIVASVLILALVGPAGAEEQECPVAFLGATVVAHNFTDGVSLEFRNTNRAYLAQMRTEIRDVAAVIEQHGTELQTASEDEPAPFPPVDLAVKDIVNGARVVVRAARFRDIPVLRELAFGFAQFWKTSVCASAVVSAVRESR